MRLHEFDAENFNMRLAAIVSQVHSRIKDEGFTKEYKLDSLLNLLKSKDINVDRETLVDMIDSEPLSNIIANVKGDRVIFKGDLDSDTDAESPERSTDTLEKMAKRAAKK